MGDPGCHDPYNTIYGTIDGNRCWEYWSDPSPDDAKWREALDEAIAKVIRKEYRRLERLHPSDASARLEDAFKSIGRLWGPGGQPPRYDQWDALLYVSWYQARQIHLVCAALEQHAPTPSRKPLRVVDVGCGAWAVPIALAMLEARGHEALCGRELSVHGIEPASSMTRMGRKLWRAFRNATEERGLRTDSIERMIDVVSIFPSVDEYLKYLGPPARGASAESWLIAIHALYDDSKSDISRIRDDHRKRHASLELLTTDGKRRKRQLLESIVGPCRSGVTPIWEDCVLTETSEARQEIRKELRKPGEMPITKKYMDYLEKKVEWNRGSNPIQRDAIWVRRGP